MNSGVRFALIVTILISTVYCVCKTGQLSEFEQIILDTHNELRANHETTEKLCYAESGEDVTFTSQSWANSMAQEKKMKHSTGNYGENLAYAGSPGDVLPQKYAYINSTKAWYREIKNWNFKKSARKGSKVTGHFTQLVWRESKQLNCAYVTFDNGYNSYYVVCQYFPRGNFGNGEHFAEMVGQLTDNADVSEFMSSAMDNSGELLYILAMLIAALVF